jgi:hypothetical protein
MCSSSRKYPFFMILPTEYIVNSSIVLTCFIENFGYFLLEHFTIHVEVLTFSFDRLYESGSNIQVNAISICLVQ